MSLFGALSSGVSGLTAQSSAMGAISDNITNVSTVGYKNTQVDFQTLVTTQTSSTFYSAGGVQSRPRQDTGVQGLLASSTSQTDVAISGSGYFVVNESATPTINNEFLFTRAGSFFQDNEGYLRNTSGFYLQAWPVTANGTVTPNNESLSIPNQNVISTDYLATVNLNRVGGTAAATTTIGVGANLPSNDTTGQTHKTDVQFFDTLGNANTMSFVYTKQSRDNQWDVTTTPAPGASVLTLEDSSGNAYKSIGQLEFIEKPNEAATVSIDGITYEFSEDTTITSGNTRVTTTASSTTAQDVAALIDMVIITDSDFDTTNNRLKVDPGSSTTVLIEDDGTGPIAINPTGLLTSSGTPSTNQQILFTVRQTPTGYRDYEQFKFGSVPAEDDSVTINGNNYIFSTAGPVTTGSKAGASSVAAETVTLSGHFAADDVISVQINALTAVTYTVLAADISTDGNTTATYTNIINKLITAIGADAPSIALVTPTLSGTSDLILTTTGAAFSTTLANTVATNNNNRRVITGGAIATTVANLELAIEGTDPEFASGSNTARSRDDGNSGGVNTLMLSTLGSSYDVTFTLATTGNVPTHPDGTSPYVSGTVFSIDKSNAIIFDSDGLPSAINVVEVEILNFENGAANMDDDPSNSPQITLDFGDVGSANGMTQFGVEFTPAFITQNGSQFGTFAGVTIANDGLVTALFDNGETRPVFQIPLATFVNVNSLGNRTGNVWNSTEASGDPTLRTADNGPSGQITQAALEQSTVDIGAEFTKMIVVQRAFSAAAKIISTADEMLEELLRVKR